MNHIERERGREGGEERRGCPPPSNLPHPVPLPAPQGTLKAKWDLSTMPLLTPPRPHPESPSFHISPPAPANSFLPQGLCMYGGFCRCTVFPLLSLQELLLASWGASPGPVSTLLDPPAAPSVSLGILSPVSHRLIYIIRELPRTEQSPTWDSQRPAWHLVLSQAPGQVPGVDEGWAAGSGLKGLGASSGQQGTSPGTQTGQRRVQSGCLIWLRPGKGARQGRGGGRVPLVSSS